MLLLLNVGYSLLSLPPSLPVFCSLPLALSECLSCFGFFIACQCLKLCFCFALTALLLSKYYEGRTLNLFDDFSLAPEMVPGMNKVLSNYWLLRSFFIFHHDIKIQIKLL